MYTINNPYGYTGREIDTEELYYYRARYYDPTVQRFLSEDPIGFYGHDFNLYRYVWSSPAFWTDPLGLMGKGGKQNHRDSGLAPYSDEELDKMYKNPKTPKDMKQRIKKEQKARKQRNKQKRNKICSDDYSSPPSINIKPLPWWYYLPMVIPVFGSIFAP